MSQFFDGKIRSAKAAGAIGKYILVKGPITAVDVAGLADVPFGVADRVCTAAGDVLGVILRSGQGTIPCIANAAIVAGAVVYGTANGKIDDAAGTGAIEIGVAVQAATAAGDVVEVIPC